MDQLKNWLKKGRYVWFICGNYHHEEAIKLVENVRAKFALQTMKVDDIGEVQPLKLEEGSSYLVRIPLEDVKNENSAVLTYYQGQQHKGDIKTSLLNQLVMQYISEPFFDDLRTKQQLGYVVFSRHEDIRDVLGCQFLIQSSHKSCEFLINCINIFLIRIREEIKNITDEVVEVQKTAIHTQIAEKDINLNRENGRFWNEIASHQYEFDRQAKQIEILKTIKKEEFVAHFEEVFFSATTKRMDLELTSTPHEEEQAKYLESNKEHEIFKQLKRVIVEDSMEDFKKKCAMHPNFYKECFLKFRA